MKKRFFCFMYVMFIGAAIFAQQPVIAKAPPMVMMNPLTADEASSVGGVYDKMLSEAKSVRIINNLVIDKGMRDYGFQPKDWTNAEKTIALGEVLNIDWVVRPQVQKRVNRNNSEIIIAAVLLNIQTREIICTAPVMLKNVNEAQNKIVSLINEITQIITGGTGGIALSNQPSAVYKIGDRGPAGGWVFYDKGKYSDGWRYLEVAPRGTERTLPKARIVEKIKGTDTRSGIETGSGKLYTEIILQSNQNYQLVKAAKICADMELNWFEDWFLPSNRELSHLRSIPAPEFGGPNLGGFSVGYYWASSTYTDNDSVLFGTQSKSQEELFVRAVHAF